MTVRRLLPILIALAGILAACQNKPEQPAGPARDLKEEERLHKAGLVLIPDLQHASAWEELIHQKLGVPSSKIEVQAGAGFTTLIIHDLSNKADADGIANGLRDYAAKNPDKLGPTKVESRLNNEPAAINPFVLPTEGNTAPTNPGSVLPTLSLPPLRLDDR